MPTEEMTRLAKQAVAGAEDSMREFLLRADSEYLDQFRTPEMAAEKYLELSEDAAEESGVDPVMAPPESPSIRRAMVETHDRALENMGNATVGALEPYDRLMEKTKGFARDALNEGLIRDEMQPGQPMHSASIALKEGRHDKAATLLEQMLRQDDAAGAAAMSPVARERAEAMLRTARMVEQDKARQAAVADRARALEEQYNTEAGATRAAEERERLEGGIRDLGDLRSSYSRGTPSSKRLSQIIGAETILDTENPHLLSHDERAQRFLDFDRAGIFTLSPEVKQLLLSHIEEAAAIDKESAEENKVAREMRVQMHGLSENEQILRKHAALLESKNPYRNQRAGGGMTTEK